MKRKTIIQTFSIWAVSVFIILTSGCAIGPTIRTYSGDKLQKSEVAVIKGAWFFALLGYGGQNIDSVDGNELQVTKVEVLPGWHKLVIRDYAIGFLPWGSSPSCYATVEYNFEAGHKYIIQPKSLFKDDYFIVDANTGAIISEFSW